MEQNQGNGSSQSGYLTVNWLPIITLWSAVYQKEWSKFQLCNTNMLVEAWHHLLKSKFMQGK
jgi:hypothetical protein